MTSQLIKSTYFKKPEGPVLLIILDGVGIGPSSDENAVHNAKTPYLDKIMKSRLYTTLKAHGTAVGMPTDADMGNSEVGHNALGAGRVFEQGSLLVKQAIENKTLFKSKSWIKGINQIKNTKNCLHLIGLLSDGNVHNHIDYQIALINQAVIDGIKKIRLHILLDGRDVDARSALNYIDKIEKTITMAKKKGVDIEIASGGGRMVITMDRYNADWEMVRKGWETHVLGKGSFFKNAKDAVTAAYKNDSKINDQYIPPFVIQKNNQSIGPIEDGDTVFFTNFRGDRAIELSEAFEKKEFNKFDRVRVPKVFYAGMLQYDGDQNIPNNYLVNPPKIKDSISEYLCNENLKSFAISETQKYGHVTYFWNGNKSGYINKQLEDYIEIPSDNCPFNEKPEMKANEITKKSISLLESKKYDFARINFPNGDMVGHTGDYDATVKSLEVTDKCTQILVEANTRLNGITIILADHGNADKMFSIKNGSKIPQTAHTLNPVPCAIINANDKFTLSNIETPGLANVAATICNLLGYSSPSDYEPSLLNEY
tara:strand:+ start:5939 stop:7558 length:1620 start_codon:yes stop_codon:yes gene_type:complete